MEPSLGWITVSSTVFLGGLLSSNFPSGSPQAWKRDEKGNLLFQLFDVGCFDNMGLPHPGNDRSNQPKPICDSHGCSWWFFPPTSFSHQTIPSNLAYSTNFLPTPSVLAGAQGGITHSEREPLSTKKVEQQIYRITEFWPVSKSWNEIDTG